MVEIRDAQPGEMSRDCDGCGRPCDACDLILFGFGDHNLYCSAECMPPEPKPASGWQWVRMMLGLWFTANNGKRYRFG